ncbi:MAG TPA: N,N-dimethylformamidase beta subunit family domain-containing protein [Nitrososphaeraceae archaeon]
MVFSLTNVGISYASHCVEYVPAMQTIALMCGSASLYDILDNLGPNQALVKEPNGVWVLNANLIVGNSATLNINSTYTSWLKINSTGSAEPFHIHVLGNLNLDSVKVSSWDFNANNYTQAVNTLPRPYIAILPGATGTTNITNSEISFLGYDFPLREGLSFFGGQNNLDNNQLHHLFYGILNSTKNLVANNNTLHDNIHDTKSLSDRRSESFNSNSTDKAQPYVAIRYPVSNSTLPFKDITVQGTAIDEESSISKVEVFEHTFPFNNQFPYKLAIPSMDGDWKTWQYRFNLTQPGLHRISARVTDEAGNQNWAESLFEVTFENSTDSISNASSTSKRLAIVNPVFTDGAYNVGGFYEFYPKYDNVSSGFRVKTDLDLLTGQIPDYDPESKKAAILLQKHLENLTGSTVYDVSDEDVHQGYIFNNDGSNAYDALFLLHDEYATKQSYSNLKKFVTNGGTLVFIDGNVMYAEIKYNPDMHSVVLLRGHNWRFDGTFAQKNVHERWLNENKDWIGSNFLYSALEAPVLFFNNPFNYTHFEENYVSNPKANILYDYGAKIPPQTLRDNHAEKPLQIATYTLPSGKGKVVMIGLYGQRLLDNAAFLKFMDNIIIPQSIGNSYSLNDTARPIYYYLPGGNVSKIAMSKPGQLSIELTNLAASDDKLILTIPKIYLSTNATDSFEELTVLADGNEVAQDVFVADNEIGITIPLQSQTKKIELTL